MYMPAMALDQQSESTKRCVLAERMPKDGQKRQFAVVAAVSLSMLSELRRRLFLPENQMSVSFLIVWSL